MNEREAAEEIFNLRKQIDKCAAAGNTDEISRLLLQISQLQQKSGVTTGAGKGEYDERTA